MSTSAGRTRASVERVADRATDVTELFGEVTAELRKSLPFDGWCGHTLDPATAMPTGGDARQGYRPDLVGRLLEIEYVVGDVNSFQALLRRERPVGTIHDATEGNPESSARYREVVVPSGFEHELRLVFRHRGRPWGALVLLRAEDAPGFSRSEAALMADVSALLAEAVKRLLLREYVDAGGTPRQSGLPWSLGDRVAVSLQPSAPHDLTALALDAYDLSGRERQAVELVLLGHSTAEIGAQLFLSPYTVQYHLKSVFDKTGVRSRRELAADLFFRHYLPRIERGTRINADGWFADEA